MLSIILFASAIFAGVFLSLRGAEGDEAIHLRKNVTDYGAWIAETDIVASGDPSTLASNLYSSTPNPSTLASSSVLADLEILTVADLIASA